MVNKVDLWRVGRGLRQGNPAFLIIVVGVLFLHYVPPKPGVPNKVTVAVAVLAAILVAHIALANAFHNLLAGFAVDGKADWRLVVLALLPVVSGFVIVVANIWAWRSFRRIGLPWHPLGWSERELRNAFARCFCRQCGYNLTGNISGRCPECGTQTGLGMVPSTPRVVDEDCG